MSASELAAKIDGAEGTIRDYERGKSVPGGFVVAQLATLGVNPTWLLINEGPMLLRDLVRPRPPVDAELLTGVISGVESHLAAEGLELAPEKKGQLIALLYEQCQAEGEVRPATILRLVRLAA